MSWLLAPEELNKTLFFPTVALGLVFTFLYGYKCWRGLLKFREAMLINIFLQCGGLVAGILLMLITLSSAINSSYTPLPLPTFIGGVLVAAVSVKGLYEEVLNPPTPKGEG